MLEIRSSDDEEEQSIQIDETNIYIYRLQFHIFKHCSFRDINVRHIRRRLTRVLAIYCAKTLHYLFIKNHIDLKYYLLTLLKIF